MNIDVKPTLVDDFFKYVASLINDDQIYPHPCWAKTLDGSIKVMALAMSPGRAYQAIRAASKRCDELIFGFDRRSGQSTLSDALVGAHWLRQTDEWRVFVMEYQHDPRIVKAINWSNAYWTLLVRDELSQVGLCEAPDSIN